MIYDATKLTKAIEARFPAGEPTNHALSVTGEPYVVIGNQAEGFPKWPGTVDEGQKRGHGFDAETAYFAALACFNSYAEDAASPLFTKDRCGVLYWRTKPTLEWNEDHTRCAFYMRLLISEKPPRKKAA